MSVQKAKYGTPVALAIILASCASTQPTANSLLGSPAAANAAEVKGGDSATMVENAFKQAQAQRLDGDLQGAASTLGQLVLFAPDDPRFLGEYGKVLAAQGRADDAIAFLQRSVQLQSNDWSVFSAMGVAYDQKANYNSAKLAYGRALALKPGEPSVLSNAALSRMLAGDLDGAELMLVQASADGKDPKIAKNLALVRSLKAPAPTQVARAAAPAPAPVKEASTVPAPAPVAAARPAPAPVASAKPSPAPAPVAANSPVPSIKPQLKTYEMLKNDPTVRMAPIPREEVAAKPATAPHVASAAPAANPMPVPRVAPAPVAKTAQAQPAPEPAPNAAPPAPAKQAAAPAKIAPAPVATAAPQPIVKDGAMQVQKTAAKEASEPKPKPAAEVKADAAIAQTAKADTKPATAPASTTAANVKATANAGATPAAATPDKANEAARPVIVITGKPRTPPVETAMLRPTLSEVTAESATAHKNTPPQGQ